jgi:hypothetical protein
MNSISSRITLAAALLAAVLTAGCETAPGRHPRTTTVVVLVPDRPTPDVPVGLVSAVKIVLPGPDPASDYIWVIGSNNNKVLEEMDLMKTGPAVAPRTGVETTLSFYVLKPGKSVLRFFLVRPSDQEAVPKATCHVTIRASE